MALPRKSKRRVAWIWKWIALMAIAALVIVSGTVWRMLNRPQAGLVPKTQTVNNTVERTQSVQGNDGYTTFTDVIEIKLHNGDMIVGALDTVDYAFTYDLAHLEFDFMTKLTQTRDAESIYIATDDPNQETVNYEFFGGDDQAFSVDTEQGIRIISMYNVQEITVKRGETLRVPEQNAYVRPAIILGTDIEFAPQGTATVFLKDGTQFVTYPGCFSQVDTTTSRFPYGDNNTLPEYAQTRNFYFEEAKIVRFKRISDSVYEITGELASGEPIKKFVTDEESTTPYSYKLFTAQGKVVNIDVMDIDRIEVDMSVTPTINIEETARITLRDNTVFHVPSASVEFVDMHSRNGIPYPSYETGMSIYLEDDDTEMVPFNTVKKILFTPYMKTEENDCPGVITYKDGTEESVSFAIGEYYTRRLSFFCPYLYSYPLGNTESNIFGGTHERISDVRSIEFGLDAVANLSTDMQPGLDVLVKETDSDIIINLSTDMQPELGALVKETLGLDSDTCMLSELQGITKIVCKHEGDFDHGITNLSGLKYLTGLLELNLDWNRQLEDISPLKGMTGLRSLSLVYTHVSDVSALENCTRIEELDLSGLRITDFSALSSMTALKSLNLSWINKSSDLSTLKNCTQIEEIDLTNSRITDISVLSSMTALKTLRLSWSDVSDLNVLKNCTQIEELYLISLPITDISALSNMTALKTLDVSWTKISDLSALENCTQIETLYLSGVPITDLSVLSGKTKLKALSVIWTKISDFSALQNYTQIEELDLEDLPIADINILSGMTALKSLNLHGTDVSDVSALKNCTQMEKLDLSGLAITDISALSGMTALKELNLGGSTSISDVSALENCIQMEKLDLSSLRVTDISVLGNMTALKELNLRNANISDISILKNCTQMEKLDLTLLPVTDISALGGMAALKTLHLSWTKVSDVSTLANCARMEHLYLTGIPITDISALSGMTALKALNLQYTNVSDVSALKNLKELTELELDSEQ